MKLILCMLTIAVIAGCSKPIEGLWIEKHEGVLYDEFSYPGSLLKFHEDSVVHYFMDYRIGDTLRYKLTDDSIMFSGVNPQISGGHAPLQFSAKYLLTSDSLHVWYDHEYKTSYFRSNSENLKEYFLSKGGLDIKLPRAENVKRTSRGRDALNIRIGFLGEAVKIFVNDEETNINELDDAIKKFKQSVDELDRAYIISQLFIDERVTCEYMFLMVEYLRVNNISGISFIAENDEYDPYTNYFRGLRLYFPREKVNYVVEE